MAHDRFAPEFFVILLFDGSARGCKPARQTWGTGQVEIVVDVTVSV